MSQSVFGPHCQRQLSIEDQLVLFQANGRCLLAPQPVDRSRTIQRLLPVVFLGCLAIAANLNAKDAKDYVNRGDVSAKKNAHDKAIAEYYDQVLTLVPSDADDYCYRGYVWQAKGEYDKAIAEFSQALKLNPNYADAFYNRGYVWQAKGEFDKAIADYSQALKLNPKSANAYYNRGNAWFKKDKYDKAIADLDQALAIIPNGANAYGNRGAAWARKGEYDKAIADFNQALVINPTNANTYGNRGAAWERKGEYDKAIADYHQVLAINAKDANAYGNRGAAWERKGEYDKAIADYNQALVINPTNANTYGNRGTAWERKGDYDKAIADYNHALTLNPNFAAAYYNRGVAWARKAEYDKAIADYNQALVINPNDANTYSNRGNAWARKGEYDKAMADFNQALVINPKYAEAYGDRGATWERKGEYDKAIADYNQALAINPKYANAYGNRGAAWARKAEYDKAIADYNQALVINPNDANTYSNRGNAWARKGEYDKAIADYNQALTLNPNFADAYSNLGGLYATCPDEKCRDGKKAVAKATKACELSGCKQWNHVATLAAAYAESGDFDKAKEWEVKAIEMAPVANIKQALRFHLDLYNQGKPFHEPVRRFATPSGIATDDSKAKSKDPAPNTQPVAEKPPVTILSATVEALPKTLTVDLNDKVKLEFVLIPAGKFLMGSPDLDKDAFPQEKPQHRVRITKPFYLGKYLVTQEQWQAMMDANPSRFKALKNPVENVSWNDCQQFLEKLNEKLGTGRGKFQVPTEAQWEYACRAGSTTRYYFGDDESKLGDYAWFGKNSGNTTHAVGQKKPNAWGLYDMHGNVFEWCQDLFNQGYDTKSPIDDPVDTRTELVTPPAKPGGTTIVINSSGRVFRGGCFAFQAEVCQSSCRLSNRPDARFFFVGFRVSLIPEDK